LEQLILPSTEVLTLETKPPKDSNNEGGLLFANEFLTSQLVFISNKVQLVGYACDQMSQLLNPRETELTPEVRSN